MHPSCCTPPRHRLAVALLCAVGGPLVAFTPAAEAQSRPVAESGAWFGVATPPRFGEAEPVIIGPRGPVPFSAPQGETPSPDLRGEILRRDLETIVNFARESRTAREIGEGQLWGRISGFPSAARTIQWAADEFRRAGIQDVRFQTFQQEPNASFWLPISWEVKLLGDPAFGPGTADVVLESAVPLNPSEIEGGVLTAPVVFVGTATPAVLEHIDVRGKIAVQQIIPQGHMVFERTPAVPRARDLLERGALAVVNAIKLPGNERAWDFSNCGGPCFNLGGRDGLFLETVLDRAAEAGMADRIQMQIRLRTDRRSGLSAHNALAVVPGRSSEETIVVNAHADSWFDGAGDNADGLAVTMALARHFAKPENRPDRTLVFVVTAGHHSPGMNGPRNFVAMNPELIERSVLVINVEHVAQRNFTPSRTSAPDGYRETVADVGEAPIVPGITNRSPFINELFSQGVTRYGVNFISDLSTLSSGETGGYSGVDVPKVTLIQAPPLYHTSGEVVDVISTPGMERMAHFLAYFLRETGKAPRAAIAP